MTINRDSFSDNILNVSKDDDNMSVHSQNSDAYEMMVNSYKEFMVNKHIPEIFATKCFHEISFQQLDDTVFRVQYSSMSQEDLDRYLQSHAPAFREDFVQNFPTITNVNRKIFRVMSHWGARPVSSSE